MFTADKQVHTVIVFYDEENRERAEKLIENMEQRDNFVTKKYQVDFVEGANVVFLEFNFPSISIKLVHTMLYHNIDKYCYIHIDFVKSHADLVKCYDFALYLLSLDDAVVSSLTMKSTQTPFIPDDNTSPKKYIIVSIITYYY